LGAAERIREDVNIPDVRPLAILRNQVDCEFSAYMHAIRGMKEAVSSFKAAFEMEQERINAGWGILWHYTQAGFYYEQLNRYYQVFDPHQIKVVLYDDLVKDSDGLLRDTLIFSGLTQHLPQTPLHVPTCQVFPRTQSSISSCTVCSCRITSSSGSAGSSSLKHSARRSW